ncbi:MAG: ABC transporter permease [Desulfobacterales bacterium]|nr:ABC transporter permease [Desulfobacterales bacterium]
MSLLNLLRFISLRHMRLQKAQTFMAVSGICLGVAAIVSIGIINNSILFSFEDSINKVTGKAVLQITGAQSGFPEELLEKVQGVTGVEYAVPIIDTHGILVGGKEESLMILGIDVLIDHQIRSYSLSEDNSDIPDPLLFLAKPDSILITNRFAEREKIKLEQKINIQTVQGIKTLKVRGLLNPEGPAKAMDGNIAIMDIYAAQMAFGKEGRIDRIDVSILKGETIESVKKRIEDALPKGYNVDTPEGRTKQVEILLSTFQRNINLISFIAVFVGMYLIYNAVSIAVVHRKKEIGILRAIGTKRGQIIRLFLSETLVIAVIGSSLGIGFGIFLAKSLVSVFGQVVSEIYMRTSVNEISISYDHLIKGFFAGIITSIIAAMFPAISSSRITPISAIRSVPFSEDGFFTKKKLGIASIFFVVCAVCLFLQYKLTENNSYFHSSLGVFVATLFILIGLSLATPAFLKAYLLFFRRFIASKMGSSGKLAGLNLQKNINRNAVAAAAVFYGISVFVSTAGFMYSAKMSVMRFIDNAVKAEILITSGHPLATTGSKNIPMPLDMLKEVEKIPGVLQADPFRKLYVSYNNRRTLLLNIDVARRLSYSSFMVVSGEEKNLSNILSNKDNVLINEGFALKNNIKPGDSIVLPTPNGQVSFGVAAIIVEYTSDIGSILMDIHTYQRYWKERLADTIAVRVKDKKNSEAVRKAIQDKFGNDRKLFVLLASEFKKEIRKIIDQVFVFNYMLNVITLTIASLGIIVTLLASVLERTREIGILRAIGMLKKQVSQVVVLESMLLGLAGGTLGCVAGIVNGWMTLDGFYRSDFGASAQYFIPYASIIWAIIISGLLSAIAGIYPARRAAKTNIVEALAYE